MSETQVSTEAESTGIYWMPPRIIEHLVVLGAGKVSVIQGPTYPSDPLCAAAFLAPPGQRLPTPEGFDKVIEGEGWRLASYEHRAHEEITPYAPGQRPDYLLWVSFEEARQWYMSLGEAPVVRAFDSWAHRHYVSMVGKTVTLLSAELNEANAEVLKTGLNQLDEALMDIARAWGKERAQRLILPERKKRIERVRAMLDIEKIGTLSS